MRKLNVYFDPNLQMSLHHCSTNLKHVQIAQTEVTWPTKWHLQGQKWSGIMIWTMKQAPLEKLISSGLFFGFVPRNLKKLSVILKSLYPRVLLTPWKYKEIGNNNFSVSITRNVFEPNRYLRLYFRHEDWITVVSNKTQNARLGFSLFILFNKVWNLFSLWSNVAKLQRGLKNELHQSKEVLNSLGYITTLSAEVKSKLVIF